MRYREGTCPHCRGPIKKVDNASWQYLCLQCGRVWIILDGKYWLAGFDAGGHVYEITSKGELIDHNSFRDEELREKLWDRWRNRK